MARWNARVEFLLDVIGILFLSLTVEPLQGKRCQDSLLSGGGRSVRAKISGERVVPGEYFLVSFAIQQCKLHRATCRRFDTIPACDGRTDGQTDRQTELP